MTYTPFCVYIGSQRPQPRVPYPIFKLVPFKFNKIDIFENNYGNIHPAERTDLMAGKDWGQEIEKFIRAQPSP